MNGMKRLKESIVAKVPRLGRFVKTAASKTIPDLFDPSDPANFGDQSSILPFNDGLPKPPQTKNF